MTRFTRLHFPDERQRSYIVVSGRNPHKLLGRLQYGQAQITGGSERDILQRVPHPFDPELLAAKLRLDDSAGHNQKRCARQEGTGRRAVGCM